MCSLKPLDSEAILKAAANSRVLLSLEEQSIYGGLGSAVAEVLAQHETECRFKIMGIRDQFIENVGDWTETRQNAGLTTERAKDAIRSMLHMPAMPSFR